MKTMNRVIKIYYDDLTEDRDNCSAMINTACSRRQPMRVTGLLAGEDFFLVNLEECPPSRRKYNFAPMDGGTADELGAELSSRYFAGFTLEGGFLWRDVYWALFSSVPDEKASVTESGRHA